MGGAGELSAHAVLHAGDETVWAINTEYVLGWVVHGIDASEHANCAAALVVGELLPNYHASKDDGSDGTDGYAASGIDHSAGGCGGSNCGKKKSRTGPEEVEASRIVLADGKSCRASLRGDSKTPKSVKGKADRIVKGHTDAVVVMGWNEV